VLVNPPPATTFDEPPLPSGLSSLSDSAWAAHPAIADASGSDEARVEKFEKRMLGRSP
jgi:hypothetical protein